MWGGARAHQARWGGAAAGTHHHHRWEGGDACKWGAWDMGARASPECHSNLRRFLYRKCAKIIMKMLEIHQKNQYFGDESSKRKMDKLLPCLSV